MIGQAGDDQTGGDPRLKGTTHDGIAPEPEYPWVVFVSDIPLAPGAHGSQSRARAMVRALREAGYKVGYVLWERYPCCDDDNVERMKQQVDELTISPFRPPAPPPQATPLTPIRKWLAARLPRPAMDLLNSSYRLLASLYAQALSLPGRVRGRFRWWRFQEHDPKDWYPLALQDALDLMLRSRPAVAVIAHYPYLAQALPAASSLGILGVLDTIDVFHRQHGFHRAKKKLPDDWFFIKRETEARLLDLADLVIAIQPQEEQVISTMVDPAKVIRIEHGVVGPSPAPGQAACPTAVMLVGSDNLFNSDGLEWFLSRVWPQVLRAEPEAALHVFGKLAKTRVCHGPRVYPHGFVEDLGSAYAQGNVVINPVRFGTGLKIKTVEAMAHGKAVVATPCGAEGLEDASGSALLVARDAQEFAGTLNRLLQFPEEAHQVGARAAAYALKRFSPPAVYAPLLRKLSAPRPGWAYQLARASGPSGLRLPGPPDPDLQPRWRDAWRKLADHDLQETSALVRAAGARAGGIDVELWCARPIIGEAELHTMSLARGLAGLGFRCRVRLPESCWKVKPRFESSGCQVVPLNREPSQARSPHPLVYLASTQIRANLEVQRALARGDLPWVNIYYRTSNATSPLTPEEAAELRSLWRRAARVCFPSEYSRKLAGVSIGLQGVAHATVWCGAAAPAPAPEGSPGLPTKGEDFVLLWWAPVFEEGRPDLLFRAVRQAVELGLTRPVSVWMGGSGPSEDPIKDQVHRLGLERTVHMLGGRIDLAAVCAAADGLILTSDRDDLPLSVVEAMWREKPIVCTAAGGVSEIVRQGQDAILCAPGDAWALARGIQRVVNEPALALRLGKSASRVAREALTSEETALRLALIGLDSLGARVLP
jgi:glycosyltransferase involved in cell wall biosynthesis